jgi:hypothetical protein
VGTDRGDQFTFSGGQIIGATFGGQGNEVHVGDVHPGGGQRTADLVEQLRAELRQLRAAIAALPPDHVAEPEVLQRDVDELIKQVGAAGQDQQATRGRWANLARRIPASLKDLGNLTKIAELILKLTQAGS